MHLRHGMSDGDWEILEPLFLKACGNKGRKPKDNRLFIHAILWIGKTGAPWRDLPEQFGHFRSVHKRLSDLCRRGVFETLFRLARRERNVVERLFMGLKSWRRLAQRFEKRGRIFAGFVLLHAARDWILA